MKFWSGVVTENLSESKEFFVRLFGCQVVYDSDWFVLLWFLDNGADVQVMLFFSTYGLFLLAEIYFPQRTVSPKRRSRWPVNVLLTGSNIAVLSVLPVTFFTLAIWAEANRIGRLNRLTFPLTIAVIINLLLRGLISFFTHWLMHKVPWFWRLHRVHHFDTELDVTSTVRFHPLEFVVTLLPGMLMVIIFGLSPWILLACELLDASVTVFSHANICISNSIDR